MGCGPPEAQRAPCIPSRFASRMPLSISIGWGRRIIRKPSNTNPSILIECGNNESNSAYLNGLKVAGRKIRSTRFPAELPRFFIEFCTDPHNLVLDPFAGSNTTDMVAEKFGRRWRTIEENEQYWKDSKLRFFREEHINDDKDWWYTAAASSIRRVCIVNKRVSTYQYGLEHGSRPTRCQATPPAASLPRLRARCPTGYCPQRSVS